MKPKYHELISRAVEEGVAYGFNRAHKHIDKPSDEVIKDSICEQVMNSICEVFDFED